MKEMRYYNTVAFVYRGATLFIIEDGGGAWETLGLKSGTAPAKLPYTLATPDPRNSCGNRSVHFLSEGVMHISPLLSIPKKPLLC